MGKSKRDLGVDRNGVPKMMRKRDYLADMSGQIGMNLVANVIGQLTYFYTDKVGLAVGGVGNCHAYFKNRRCTYGSMVWKCDRSFQGRKSKILSLASQTDDSLCNCSCYAVLCSNTGRTDPGINLCMYNKHFFCLQFVEHLSVHRCPQLWL